MRQTVLWLVRHTSLLSVYSSVRHIVLSRMTSFIRLIHFITEIRNGNEASNLNVLHENGNHGRADDSRYVAHHLASKKCYDRNSIQIVRVPHINTKRRPLTTAGSQNIPVVVHVVATYDNFQAVTRLFVSPCARLSP